MEFRMLPKKIWRANLQELKKMSFAGSIASSRVEKTLKKKEHTLFYLKQEPHLPGQYMHYLDYHKLMNLAKEIFAEGH